MAADRGNDAGVGDGGAVMGLTPVHIIYLNVFLLCLQRPNYDDYHHCHSRSGTSHK